MDKAHEEKETEAEEKSEKEAKHRYEPGEKGECKKCGERITHASHERPLVSHKEKQVAADNGEA